MSRYTESTRKISRLHKEVRSRWKFVVTTFHTGCPRFLSPTISLISLSGGRSNENLIRRNPIPVSSFYFKYLMQLTSILNWPKNNEIGILISRMLHILTWELPTSRYSFEGNINSFKYSCVKLRGHPVYVIRGCWRSYFRHVNRAGILRPSRLMLTGTSIYVTFARKLVHRSQPTPLSEIVTYAQTHGCGKQR